MDTRQQTVVYPANVQSMWYEEQNRQIFLEPFCSLFILTWFPEYCVTPVLMKWRDLCKISMYSACWISNICVFAALLLEIDYRRNDIVCIVLLCGSTCFTTLFILLWLLLSSSPLVNPCRVIRYNNFMKGSFRSQVEYIATELRKAKKEFIIVWLDPKLLFLRPERNAAPNVFSIVWKKVSLCE